MRYWSLSTRLALIFTHKRFYKNLLHCSGDPLPNDLELFHT